MSSHNEAQMQTPSHIVEAIFCQRMSETFVLKLEAILTSVCSCVPPGAFSTCQMCTCSNVSERFTYTSAKGAKNMGKMEASLNWCLLSECLSWKPSSNFPISFRF